jgi:hypothetical protein
MATIILGAAGTAIGGPVGGYIGAAIGSYIDNALLFPPPDVKGPRLDGFALGTATEGSPVNFCLGPANRVPGALIWSAPPHEDKHQQGKGGPSATTYSYWVDIAVEFCGNPIESFETIWANGRPIYKAHPNIDIVSTQIVATTYTDNHGWGEQVTFVDVYSIFTSPSGGPDLSQFQAGKDITSSGWSTAGNNVTARVVKSSKDALTGISYVHFRNSSAAADAGGESVTLHQTLPNFNSDKIYGFTFYLGTETQNADPIIQAYEGTSKVSGNRGAAYVVIQGLQLEDFGNQLPQMQAEVVEASTRTLATAISKILDRAGRPSSSYDVSGITGNINGYTIRGPQQITQQLTPLLFAYDISTQEDNGVLRFFHRNAAQSVTIASTDLASSENGQDTPHPFSVTKIAEAKLPAKVTVSYVDPASEYQQGAQIESKNDFSSESTLSVDLGQLVLTATEARTIARRVLWESWANSKTYQIQLPPSYLKIAENDRLSITTGGITHKVICRKVDQGANFLLQIEAISEQDQVLTYNNVTTEPPTTPTGSIYTPPEMLFVVIDTAPLRDEELNTPGIYLACAAYDIETQFRGASYFRSTDGGSSYTDILDVVIETTMGRTTGTLGTATVGFWDSINTVSVVMYDGTLASATELEVLNGANHCMIGKEVMAFKTATLTGAGTYTLSGFLRGLRATDDFVTTHAANELFILLEASTVAFRSISYASINSSPILKCVPAGGLVADYTSQTGIIKANNLRPFSPIGVTGVRDGSDNLTISWIRRTRALIRMFGGTGVPLAEETEKYEIDIYVAAVYKRTLYVTAATSTVYSIANRTTDGNAGTTVDLKIYQISAAVGRSKFFSATI